MKIIHILPEEPVEGLLNSMATCQDHSFGIPRFNESEEQHKERQRRLLILMRKFYDEVSGHGYFKYDKNPNDKEILQVNDFKNLHRFYETSLDNEGYDVDKNDMERLAEIGVVQHKGKDIYFITSFGQFVLEKNNLSSFSAPLKTEQDSFQEFEKNKK